MKGALLRLPPEGPSCRYSNGEEGTLFFLCPPEIDCWETGFCRSPTDRTAIAIDVSEEPRNAFCSVHC
jgi:hypothetical protein